MNLLVENEGSSWATHVVISFFRHVKLLQPGVYSHCLTTTWFSVQRQWTENLCLLLCFWGDVTLRGTGRTRK